MYEINEGTERMPLGLKSQLKDESHFYLKIGKGTSTVQPLEANFVPQPGFNYRIVHNLVAASALHYGQEFYVDHEYTIDPSIQFPNSTDNPVIVRRLHTLYGITNLPAFFDQTLKPTNLNQIKGQPHCIRELSLFDMAHYKSLFISQKFEASGKYILTTNINGRFEVVSIDDRIPIYEKTMEPIWGLDYQQPWEILLIKAWAKIKGGYHKVAISGPFEFIEAFSNSTWKYFNLIREPERFMKQYQKLYESNSKFSNGKIILKTRKEQAINAEGMISNSACYELIAIFLSQHKKKGYQKTESQEGREFVMVVRTTEQPRFNGTLNFYRLDCQYYQAQGMNLEHDMLLTEKQFLRFFISAYITSKRNQDYFTGYKILNILPFERKAKYFEFTVTKTGFFDFGIMQFDQNRIIGVGEQSKLFLSDVKSIKSNESRYSKQYYGEGKRYLKVKYILVKDTAVIIDEPEGSERLLLSTSRMKEIRGNRTELIKIKSEMNIQNNKSNDIRGSQIGNNTSYNIPRFVTYEIEYFKGYKKGESHFVKLDPGRYILRFKSQQIDQNARFAINWTCSDLIDIVEAKLRVEEQIQLLHDSMISIMHKYPHFSFDKQSNSEMITLANTFQEIGFGFLSVKSSNNCSRSIIIQVDPRILDQEGYRLKGKFKIHSDDKKAFIVKVERGEYNSIVFKKKKDAKNFIWPTNAFNIYRKQTKPNLSLSKIESRKMVENRQNPSNKNV